MQKLWKGNSKQNQIEIGIGIETTMNIHINRFSV